MIFRNKIVPELPLSWIDTPTSAELRRRLKRLCNDTDSGSEALAIPHNPNLSNGQMFAVSSRERAVEDQRAEAGLRASLEPLVEMVQMKGESECRNGLYGVAGGPDELCDFEKIRAMPGAPFEDCEEGSGRGALQGKGCVSRLDYVRYALVEGLREEARATSGPRIRPRLFAGWDLPGDLCDRRDWVARGYRHGVPMGGELRPGRSRQGASPRFAAAAFRDPGTEAHPGGLLQRLQIVKVWLGADGLFHQAVQDVAGNPENGAAVDLATCEQRGAGADTLCAVWEDPDFAPAMPSIYYARVIETPSCRWSTLQCLAFPSGRRPDGCDDPRVPRLIQERAWTSPIWYRP